MEFNSSCPIPISQYPHVLMAHGGGGKLMHQLIGKMFLTAFTYPLLEMQHDSTVVEWTGKKLAFTTDSYVVRPIFFPGGDIGSMAVHGTVNDLAMSGARPLYLSSAFILEEGLPMETLWRVVCSMRDAAQRCGVQIITGDTKVVDKGKGDGLFINTAGIGVIEHEQKIAPQNVRPGDGILVSGDLGRHGMAIMAVREGLEFESQIESDSAPVAGLVMQLLKAGIEIHCLRDLTRGGLASALNEIAEAAGVKIAVGKIRAGARRRPRRLRDARARPVARCVRGTVCRVHRGEGHGTHLANHARPRRRSGVGNDRAGHRKFHAPGHVEKRDWRKPDPRYAERRTVAADLLKKTWNATVPAWCPAFGRQMTGSNTRTA